MENIIVKRIIELTNYQPNNEESLKKAIYIICKSAIYIKNTYSNKIHSFIQGINIPEHITEDNDLSKVLDFIDEQISLQDINYEYEKINYLSYITGCLENSFEFLLKKIAKENNWIEKYRLFFPDSFSFKSSDLSYRAYFCLNGIHAYCEFEETCEEEYPEEEEWTGCGWDYRGKYINKITINTLQDYEYSKQLAFFKKLDSNFRLEYYNLEREVFDMIQEPFSENYVNRIAKYGIASFNSYEEDGYMGYIEILIEIQNAIFSSK